MIAKKFVLGRLLLLGLFTTIAFAAAGAASADPPDTYDCGLLAVNERGCAHDEPVRQRDWTLDPP